MPLTPLVLINKKLWDSAKWRDTAFLVTGDFEQQPGIGLFFEDYEAGKKIFEEWRALFGTADAKDLLRVAVIEGTHPSKRVGYTIHFSTDISKLPPADGPENYVAVASRWKFKETGGSNQSLEWFKESFKRHQMFFIVPLPKKVDGDVRKYFGHMLGKTAVYFRDYSAIASDDQDSVALGG
jgi:hypothetical protein